MRKQVFLTVRKTGFPDSSLLVDKSFAWQWENRLLWQCGKMFTWQLKQSYRWGNRYSWLKDQLCLKVKKQISLPKRKKVVLILEPCFSRSEETGFPFSKVILDIQYVASLKLREERLRVSCVQEIMVCTQTHTLQMSPWKCDNEVGRLNCQEDTSRQ